MASSPEVTAPEFNAFTIQTPDGVMISAQEWGNPNGPEILFIHGFSQSQLCWSRQVKSDLAKSFRMITYDIRGHGGSSKPLDPAYDTEDRRWADEVKAVVEGANLKRPVVVCWSYGGRIFLDYVMQYGDDRLAGINFVSALTKSALDLIGPAISPMRKMTSPIPAENLEGTLGFLKYCPAKPLPREEFERMAAYNMAVPPEVRRSMLGRSPLSEESLNRLSVPTLITHGLADQVILAAMGRYTADMIPHAATSFYEDVGHMPFWEDAPRFNRELAEFRSILRLRA